MTREIRERTHQLRSLRDRLLETGVIPQGAPLRSDIAKSWQRCVLSGVVPDGLAPQYVDDQDLDSHLRRISSPVVAKLSEQLANTSTNIMLADRTGLLLEHWTDDEELGRMLERSNSAPGFVMAETVVGNNGMGSVLEEYRPIRITGAEHFADAWVNFTCVGVPIRHPITRRLEGVLNITTRSRDANSLMLPVAQDVVRQVEQRLYLNSSHDERLLLERFLAASRSGRAIIALNADIVMSTPPAARFLAEFGQARLWEYAAAAVEGGGQGVAHPDVTLLGASSLPLSVHCTVVADGRRVIGAVLEIGPARDAETAGARARRHTDPNPAAGPEHTPWEQARAQARRMAGAGLPLLIVGEDGSGRSSLARELFAEQDAAGLMTVLDGAAQQWEDSEDRKAWLAGLETAVGTPGAVVLLRNVALLDRAVALGVCALLDRTAGEGAQLVATAHVNEVDGTAVHRPLIDRLAVGTVRVPPLRERLAELPELLAALTRRHATGDRQPRWHPDAVELLARLDWPGNLRQLENLVRQVLATRRRHDVHASDLPADIRGRSARRRLTPIERAEADAIAEALHRAGGNKSLAAQSLGISRPTLYRKMRAFGIDLGREF